MHLSKYTKSITALVTGSLGWGAVVVASEAAAITSSEWLQLAVTIAVSLGVYASPPNKG